MSGPVVAVVMGSDSDWPVMQHAIEYLERFGVEYRARIVSAHRTPDLLAEFAKAARAENISCIIAVYRLDHQVDIDRSSNSMTAQSLANQRANGQIGYIVIIHHIEVNNISPGGKDIIDLFA